MFRACDASKEWLKWNKEWVITVEALCKYEAPFWNNLKLYNGIFFTSASILSFFCYSSNLCFRSPFPAPPPSPSSLSLFFRCPLSFRYAPIRPLAVPLMSVDDAS